MHKTGKLIVIEGIDGAGTTTQVEYIYNYFKNNGFNFYKTAQPSNYEIGQLIRKILQKDIMNINNITPGFETMSLLFAADRAYQQNFEIIPKLLEGINIVCDRYVHSSVIYQSVSSGRNDSSAIKWIKEINKQIRRPDLVIYLKISEEKALHRRNQRAEKEEMFETSQFQNKLIEKYNILKDLFPEDQIVTIDASGSIEEIGNKSVDIIKTIIENGEN